METNLRHKWSFPQPNQDPAVAEQAFTFTTAQSEHKTSQLCKTGIF